MLTGRERRIAVGKDVLTRDRIVSAALGKVNYRRPPLKRVFRRTY